MRFFEEHTPLEKAYSAAMRVNKLSRVFLLSTMHPHFLLPMIISVRNSRTIFSETQSYMDLI
ncbi:MAG: hypothetical protein ACI9XK_000614 [Granulosicoccus sp.]|jgi:hypothetical protein